MRTHYCGEVTEQSIDQTVELCGWVQRRRDHGGVIFFDMRDKAGIVQIVFDPEAYPDIFVVAETVRSEYVVKVSGLVRYRPEGTVNEELSTGKIEVLADALVILNSSETPPFQVDEHHTVGEDIRLRHRYLDLRRPEMFQRLQMRAKITQTMRRYLDGEHFIDIETPYLTKATPEGARDYLVPSRTHQGSFFALPQSPQLFKQLLMVAGMDRYYQIVRCFRDEDLRADRQPEFTQLDVEMSFMEEEQIQHLMEKMIHRLFAEILQIELPNPFPRMTYAEAMSRFGTDRPDLRIPLELVDLADVMKHVEFKVFSGPANDPKGRIAALRLPNGGELTRKEIDDYTKFVGVYGAKGLAYIKINDKAQGRDGLQSPILKFLPDNVITAILERTKAENGDLVFFGADKANIVNESLGALIVKIGTDKNLFTSAWEPLWVVDFPMFAIDGANGRFDAIHHPFTAPAGDLAYLKADPANCLSRAYDIVLNGLEIGGGSVRIHDYAMQMEVFKLLHISEEQAQEKFGFLLDALKYGAPPHGGMAIGLDRLVMLMSGTTSIRDVIAFPKTQSAACLMTAAPAAVDSKQLRELGISVRQPAAEKMTGES